ncbi:hypothetical protein [Marivivens marinus]|uniref:hypothetical protein n=1 Tax=Marivivens marinus TaxID=3110173 RepID=UPI003B848973
MDDDLDAAVKLLVDEMELPSDAAEELLTILELAEKDPKKSILFGHDCLFSIRVDNNHGHEGKFWFNGKRVYEYTFGLAIVEATNATRFIVEIVLISGPT